jgi:hypothetical protein
MMEEEKTELEVEMAWLKYAGEIKLMNVMENNRNRVR